MAGNLADGEENRLLDASLGTAAFTAPTAPIKVALMTVAGSDSAAGTEVAGGSYARQSVTFGAASAGAASNTGAVTFTNMPTCTVVGVEIYDSAGTPRRIWYGPLAASRSFVLGDTFTIPIGGLVASLD